MSIFKGLEVNSLVDNISKFRKLSKGNNELENVVKVYDSIKKYGVTDMLKDFIGDEKLPFELSCAGIEAWAQNMKMVNYIQSLPGSDTAWIKLVTLDLLGTKIKYRIGLESRPAELPSKTQLKDYTDLIKNLTKYNKLFTEALFEMYTESSNKDNFKVKGLDSVDDINKFITPHSIRFAKTQGTEIMYIGGECAWDQEHGWALGVQKGKIVAKEIEQYASDL